MNINTLLILLAALLLVPAHYGQAQFRSDSESTLNRTGQILQTSNPDEHALSFLGLEDFQMNHSYEMMVGGIGGQAYNMNTYTNTMQMMFNENLYGRVDLAMSHSPFGPSLMGQDNQTQFYIRNAELNYRFSENSRIQIRFQQLPAGYGYHQHPSYHRNRYYNNPYYW